MTLSNSPLTHYSNYLLYSSVKSIKDVIQSQKKIDDIINAFKGDNCPALNGIPKWFIIQACRGKDFNYEVCNVIISLICYLSIEYLILLLVVF